MIDSLLISVFCTSYEPEIVLPILQINTKPVVQINRQNFAELKKLWIFIVFF